MWPEHDAIPPRDVDTVLPEVLRRGRELRAARRRQRQATLIGRAAATVVVVGLVTAGLRGTDDPRVDTDIAAPATTTTEGADASPSTSPELPPLSVGAGTGVPRPGSTTSVSSATGRTAPVVVLEVRSTDGRYHTAVLQRGSLEPFAVTSATAERQSPVIAPDGRTIAFQRVQTHPLTGQPRWEVFVVDPDGTNLRQVTGGLFGADGPDVLDPPLGPGSRWPTWSPDGTQLAFSCSGPTGLPQICITRADGTGRHAISFEGQGFYQPAWSPDGRMIAAKRELAPGLVDLWLLDPSGRTLPDLLPAPALDARDVTLTWLADGSLVYARSDAASQVLRVLDVGTGVERSLPISGPIRFPIACGDDQVLYLQSETARDQPQLRTGALVLTGIDGSRATTVLPKAADEERVPSSCAVR